MSVSLKRRILDETQATGRTFKVHRGGQYQVVVQGHAGGTWQVQTRTNIDTDGGAWISLGEDGEFTADGIKSMYLNPECEYRITAGTVGAQAFCIPITGGIGII